MTTLEGIVKDGKIRLNENVTLAENTKVYVIVGDAPVVHLRSPRLVNPKQARDFHKQVLDMSPDAKI